MRLGLADHREAARLVEVRCDLGEELVVAESRPRSSRRSSVSTRLANRARTSAGGRLVKRPVPVRSRKASSIESGSTSGVSASIMRADLPRDGDVLLHVRRHDDRVGTEPLGREHRHRRMHAVLPGDVAAGRDHPARAAADDQRLVGELGMVALLDRGVERVAVDVRDRETEQLLMSDQPRRAAGRAARRRPLGLERRRTVAAKDCRPPPSLVPVELLPDRHEVLGPEAVGGAEREHHRLVRGEVVDQSGLRSPRCARARRASPGGS